MSVKVEDLKLTFRPEYWGNSFYIEIYKITQDLDNKEKVQEDLEHHVKALTTCNTLEEVKATTCLALRRMQELMKPPREIYTLLAEYNVQYHMKEFIFSAIGVSVRVGIVCSRGMVCIFVNIW